MKPAVLKSNLSLSAIFAFIFLSVYGLCDSVTGMRTQRFDIHFDWELHIPFVPVMSVFYSSITPIFMLSPFWFDNAARFKVLFQVLVIEVVTAGIFFLVFPVQNAFLPTVAQGHFAFLYRFSDAINLTYNELPSLHVAFACTLGLAFGAECTHPRRFVWAIWVVGVIASTLLIHQHHILSVAAGILLFMAVIFLKGRSLMMENGTRVERNI